jgi:lipid-A-disaccharide synthase-like uncharacterized protein
MKPAPKRKKWEPAALMILVLALGMWIAFGPAGKPKFPIAPDSLTQTVRIGNDRGTLEAFKASPSDAEYTFRLWMKDIEGTPDAKTRAQAERDYGAAAVRNTLETSRNWLFRTLNITSWTSVVWVGIGLLGQLAFSGRMILQWIVSEKKRQSIITESFWWFSLFGAVTLFSYFVWRQDPIGILGQASGIVIYMRNLRLIYKHKRRTARAHALSVAGAAPSPQPIIEPKPAVPAPV